MRSYTIIIILVMSFAVFSCKNEEENRDFILEEFKSLVAAKGWKIDSVDITGLIYITKGEATLKVSLDNVRRDYRRDKDRQVLVDLVETIAKGYQKIPDSWEQAKDSIYLSLFPGDHDFQDAVHEKVTDEFSKVYVYSANEGLIWISTDHLSKWKISALELAAQANRNADLLLKQVTIGYDTIDNRKLGIIEVERASLKAALLFSPGMKEKVKADFGYPFYAVIPVRDFCYIFAEKDLPFFSERIGEVVVDEYKKSGYPITTELLKFSDKGVQSVGKYNAKE